jgi:aminopeptidase
VKQELPMSDPSNFDSMLNRYAELIVQVGLNLRAGQRLAITAPVETAPLVRRVTAAAYRAGARLVDVLWKDDLVTLARFQYAPRDSFEEFPSWMLPAMLDYATHGDARLGVYAEDPNLLKDQDHDLVTLEQKTAMKIMAPVYELTDRNLYNWCVVSMPIPSWAARVFPGLKPEEQVDRLWDAIFEVTRMKSPDPVAAWKAHVAGLQSRARSLNQRRYQALKYTGPGTHLVVGLPEGHLWASAEETAGNGITFLPNIPTEEIFTLPHKERIDGEVSATKPLIYGGAAIENMHLVFEHGRVVDFSATAGQDLLRGLIETDEGARSLGEVALVPHSSPISRSGVLFYNTLFDENASCHLALGQAYQVSLQGGTSLSREAFAAAGGNLSIAHEDFMVGSAELDIDGIRADGSAEAVMRRGEWAFRV